jgi:hypothetical protein
MFLCSGLLQPLGVPPAEAAFEDEKKVHSRKDDYGVVQFAIMYGLELDFQ